MVLIAQNGTLFHISLHYSHIFFHLSEWQFFINISRIMFFLFLENIYWQFYKHTHKQILLLSKMIRVFTWSLIKSPRPNIPFHSAIYSSLYVALWVYTGLCMWCSFATNSGTIRASPVRAKKNVMVLPTAKTYEKTRTQKEQVQYYMPGPHPCLLSKRQGLEQDQCRKKC